MHAAMIVQVESLTTFKPIIQPNMVRFNEEIFNEHEKDQKVIDQAKEKANSLLSNIIKKLESNNLLGEKLAILRKMQKQKEKRQILSERIESESHGNPG